MKYRLIPEGIIVEDLSEFDITQILECGQIFSYYKLGENHYIVLSGDQKCEVVQNDKFAKILTKNTDFFKNFFDLDENYSNFKEILQIFPEIKNAISRSYGIRILKQNLFETIVSFVISANNNIPRIKKAIDFLRVNYGKNMGDYFAFPEFEVLKNLNEEVFARAGLGYRAPQMVKLLEQLGCINVESLKNLPTSILRGELIKLSGIGPKVADCILLFGFSRKDVFPVDTWIAKVFNDYFGGTNDRNQMRKMLVDRYGNLSGIAQQYLFYFKREQ